MPNKYKNNQATALKYNSKKNGAPKVTAKGEKLIAEKIIKLAKENNIPIKKDENLSNILQALQIDEEIPVEVYSIVAEIFAFLYNMNKTESTTN